MERLHLNLDKRGYDITIGKGLLHRAGEILGIKSRALILTDSGVPSEYAEAVAKSIGGAEILTLKSGEGTKSIDGFSRVLEAMAKASLTRADALISVGGGVIGDLGGFAAASYMRGIAFYNVPTTVLSMVDSSVGGKCAINLCGIKNIVGAFYQPRGVLIDTDTLKTLDKRQISSGLCEALKMSLTSDADLFGIFEKESAEGIIANIEEVILRSLKIKGRVVELDECESGLRKILNFGHTVGHGIEAAEGMHGLYHGECVALGMIPMCAPEVKERLIPVLNKLGLPTSYGGDLEYALKLMMHDKKAKDGGIDAILVEKIGSCKIERMSITELCDLAQACPELCTDRR